MVIAVDGPSASGKGTLARKMAERLGYAYLDTGALYRAVALATIELGGDPAEFKEVEPALKIIKNNLTPELLGNAALRTCEVSEAASKIAVLPQVRIGLLEYQRDFARNPPGDVGGAVLDGRDIGTVVCPDAGIKFFVTASAGERARRRFEELKARCPDLTPEKVLEDIRQRDQRDSKRNMAPSIAAADACVLDTTNLTPAEVLEEAVNIVRARFLAGSEVGPSKG
ncbi:MAG: (d)CMP kinase [Pseudomonadota bacterium]